MPFVYSTLTGPQEYTGWTKGGGDVPRASKSVKINGGANVANPKTLITPRGIVTEVSAEDLAFLQENSHFKRHLDRGFIRVDGAKKDAEVVVGKEDMAPADVAAPLTPEDFADVAAQPEAVPAISLKSGKKG